MLKAKACCTNRSFLPVGDCCAVTAVMPALFVCLIQHHIHEVMWTLSSKHNSTDSVVMDSAEISKLLNNQSLENVHQNHFISTFVCENDKTTITVKVDERELYN
jgi:hypothetical protein